MLENDRFHKSVMDAKGVNQLLKKKKIKVVVSKFQFYRSRIVTVSLVSKFQCFNSSGTAQLSPSGSLENNAKLSKQTALYQFNN